MTKAIENWIIEGSGHGSFIHVAHNAYFEPPAYNGLMEFRCRALNRASNRFGETGVGARSVAVLPKVVSSNRSRIHKTFRVRFP